ncbi:RHS repeat domain-containing protein, partial [Lonsdalea quercina]
RLTEWEAGRLVQRDDTYYTYDRAGRLVRRQQVKPGFRAQVWHYRWDSRNQLRAVDTPTGETWYYRYDPFGRRVSKRCAERGEAVRYLWDGDQIAEVRHYRQGQQTSRRHWVHNGWELVVQQRHTAAGGWETDFVSSAPNGAPQALYDSEGELRWQAPKATLWGQRAVAETESADPGLAFAGQLRDSESGLCYNRFRYYDPAGGGYISPDPIGVLGGENNYQYAPNPLTWIDPLGLAKCSAGGSRPDTYQGVKDASAYLRSMGVSRAQRKQIIDSFDLETISVRKAGNNQFGTRFHDYGKTARAEGQYVFETFTPQTNRAGLALPPEWNGMTGIKQWQIKPGTTMIRGRAAPQFEYGSQYSGGAEQIFVLQPWKYGSLL